MEFRLIGALLYVFFNIFFMARFLLVFLCCFIYSFIYLKGCVLYHRVERVDSVCVYPPYGF